jgi:hypothetical protein
MLDPVVHAQLAQIDRVFAIILPQHLRGVMRDEITEGCREVVGCSDGTAHFFELDILAVVWEDA